MQQVELVVVFYREASILRPDELVPQTVGVVIDDEQARSRRVEPAEADVRRPHVEVVVILEEGLQVHSRREVVAHAELAEIGDEASFDDTRPLVGNRIQRASRSSRRRFALSARHLALARGVGHTHVALDGDCCHQRSPASLALLKSREQHH